MIEATGDVWTYHASGNYWLAVTTNGVVRNNGHAVMGAGIAKQAAEYYSELPERLGRAITRYGNQVYPFLDLQLLTFPTKEHWRKQSSLALIKRSALQLLDLEEAGVLDQCGPGKVAMVRPGCGHGGLRWEEVKEVLAPILTGDRYVVVDNGRGRGHGN